jgi:Luciferase-like monooxygenase
MKIGILVFLTEQSGNPGAIAREVENLGFESFFVAEHMVVPSSYTTHYPRSRDGKVPEFYARLIDPFVALAIAADSTSRIKIGTAISLLRSAMCSRRPRRRHRSISTRKDGSSWALAPDGSAKKRKSWASISRGAGSICANRSKPCACCGVATM